MSNNFVMSIAPGSATTSNGQITYTYVLTMDAAASVDESINYELKGIGSNPASDEELSRNQSLTGTVVFKPGETQKTLTVTLPNTVISSENKTFEMTLTTSLAWVSVDQNSGSVVSLISTNPQNVKAREINGKLYYDAASYKTTVSNDFVEVNGGIATKTLAGNDQVISTKGNNSIDSGDGDDVVTLGADKDSVITGKGNDAIYITQLNNFSTKIDGGAGSDTLDFSKLTGNGGVSLRLDFGSYREVFGGLTSSDNVVKNIERVIGSTMDDNIWGGKGKDYIDGGPGNDEIWSGALGDTINGGLGDDKLDGGLGGDTYIGGAGRDGFNFTGIKDVNKSAIKTDTIADFTHGEDSIWLLFGLTTKNMFGGGTFIGDQLFSKVAGQVRYTPVITDGSSSHILLQGDINGDGNVDWMIKLLGISALTIDDFGASNDVFGAGW